MITVQFISTQTGYGLRYVKNFTALTWFQFFLEQYFTGQTYMYQVYRAIIYRTYFGVKNLMIIGLSFESLFALEELFCSGTQRQSIYMAEFFSN